jgi:membrane fusion protein (multidrug efflux system)
VRPRPLPLLLAVGLALAGCGRDAARTAPASLPAVAVATATVETATLERRQPLAGTVRPADRATLAARVAGAVTGPVPALGSRVEAGATLITLGAGEIQARLAQARAVLDQVDRELAREQTLAARGATTAENVRLLEDQRRAAAAAVDEAAALQSYTSVTAPFAGVVTRRLVETGDFAAAGTPLLELEGTNRLRAEVNVPESFALPAVGTELTLESDGTALSGRLAEISPAADPSTRTRLAKVELAAGAAARSGQFVRVLWPAGTEAALLVPAAALTRFGQLEQVFVVTAAHRAELRLVRTGGREGDRVAILSGLEAGDSVVLNPSPTLREGQPLEVRR